MKKKILGIALATMTFIALPSVADDTSKAGEAKTDTTCCQMPQKQVQRFNPYEGLNLTESQQAQLKQLDEKRKAERTEKMKQAKEERKAARDKAKSAHRDLKAAKKAKLDEIKAILSTEQYVQYLENLVLNSTNKVSASMHGKHVIKGKKMHGKRAGVDGKAMRGKKSSAAPGKPRADRK